GHAARRPQHGPHELVLVDVVIQMPTRERPLLLPAAALLYLLPAVAHRTDDEHVSDLSRCDEPLRLPDTSHEVHHVTGHEEHTGLLRRSEHRHAVRIAQSNGFLTEHRFAGMGSSKNTILVRPVG